MYIYIYIVSMSFTLMFLGMTREHKGEMLVQYHFFLIRQCRGASDYWHATNELLGYLRLPSFSNARMVITMSSPCHHPVITLSSHCHHPVITLSSPCHHPVITLSSPCHHHVITMSSPCHHHVITLSSPCHHPVITLSSPCHHPVITLSSPCHHHVITMSSPCHHHVITMPVVTMSSPCRHHVVTMSSPCHHPVITLSSPCHHTVITLSSPCHHHVITMSSPCHHHVITMSSPCHHPVITLSSSRHHHDTCFLSEQPWDLLKLCRNTWMCKHQPQHSRWESTGCQAQLQAGASSLKWQSTKLWTLNSFDQNDTEMYSISMWQLRSPGEGFGVHCMNVVKACLSMSQHVSASSFVSCCCNMQLQVEFAVSWKHIACVDNTKELCWHQATVSIWLLTSQAAKPLS